MTREILTNEQKPRSLISKIIRWRLFGSPVYMPSDLNSLNPANYLPRSQGDGGEYSRKYGREWIRRVAYNRRLGR